MKNAPARVITGTNVDTIKLQAEKALSMLRSAQTLDEVKQIAAQGLAYKVLLRELEASQEAVIVAQELVTRAKRRHGELSKNMPKGKPGPKGELVPDSGDNSKGDQLECAGVSSQRASEMEELADIPEETFEEHVEALKQEGKEPTPGRVIKRHRGPRSKKPTEITIKIAGRKKGITLTLDQARMLLDALPAAIAAAMG